MTDLAGRTLSPKPGWVYAIDGTVPEPLRFEGWLLGRLRAGVYAHLVKYFNINNRHWNRKQVKNGVLFASAVSSSDTHLHMSFMPDQEYATSSILADYEVWRTTGVVVPGQRPAPAAEQMTIAELAAGWLRTVRSGNTGRVVRILQGLLLGHGYGVGDRSAIDGRCGPNTTARLKAFQVDHQVANSVVDGHGDGVGGRQSWLVLITPNLPTVIYGSDGLPVKLLQGLLCAQGYPTAVDGRAGPDTIARLKAFQVDHHVANSVVGGRGDGINGRQSWLAALRP
jgi:peptidoglycan hydrolase-like protein with peptidoglycan-binding domain